MPRLVVLMCPLAWYGPHLWTKPIDEMHLPAHAPSQVIKTALAPHAAAKYISYAAALRAPADPPASPPSPPSDEGDDSDGGGSGHSSPRGKRNRHGGFKRYRHTHTSARCSAVDLNPSLHSLMCSEAVCVSWLCGACPISSALGRSGPALPTIMEEAVLVC